MTISGLIFLGTDCTCTSFVSTSIRCGPPYMQWCTLQEEKTQLNSRDTTKLTLPHTCVGSHSSISTVLQETTPCTLGDTLTIVPQGHNTFPALSISYAHKHTHNFQVSSPPQDTPYCKLGDTPTMVPPRQDYVSISFPPPLVLSLLRSEALSRYSQTHAHDSSCRMQWGESQGIPPQIVSPRKDTSESPFPPLSPLSSLSCTQKHAHDTFSRYSSLSILYSLPTSMWGYIPEDNGVSPRLQLISRSGKYVPVCVEVYLWGHNGEGISQSAMGYMQRVIDIQKREAYMCGGVQEGVFLKVKLWGCHDIRVYFYFLPAQTAERERLFL